KYIISPFALQRSQRLNCRRILCNLSQKVFSDHEGPLLSSIASDPLGIAEHLMKVQAKQQAQEILGTREFVIITERVDDVALLIGQMVKMGFVEVLHRPIPRHWKQRGLSWGWTAVRWLADSLTAGEHRTVSVEA